MFRVILELHSITAEYKLHTISGLVKYIQIITVETTRVRCDVM